MISLRAAERGCLIEFRKPVERFVQLPDSIVRFYFATTITVMFYAVAKPANAYIDWMECYCKPVARGLESNSRHNEAIELAVGLSLLASARIARVFTASVVN